MLLFSSLLYGAFGVLLLPRCHLMFQAASLGLRFSNASILVAEAGKGNGKNEEGEKRTGEWFGYGI